MIIIKKFQHNIIISKKDFFQIWIELIVQKRGNSVEEVPNILECYKNKRHSGTKLMIIL